MSNIMKTYHMKNYFAREVENPRFFISPNKYIQGPGIATLFVSFPIASLGVLKSIGKYIVGISPFNEKRSVIVVASQGGIRRFKETSMLIVLYSIESLTYVVLSLFSFISSTFYDPLFSF